MRKGMISLMATMLMVLSGGAQSIDFTVMSFNIQQPYGNNWDERKDSAVAIIRNENPDLIGTQEAIREQRTYLLDSTDGYLYYGLGRDGDDSGEGSWIFYKADKFEIDSAYSGNFWLSETPDKPSRFGGDYNRICTYVHLTDKLSGESFYLYNAHFPTPDLYSARLSSIKLMAERMANRTLKNEPIIITGDFNSHEGDGVTKWMKSGNDNPIQSRDTYRDVYPTGKVTTGFGTKYDYIYCENRSKYIVHDSWVVDAPSKASDHMPIMASISIEYKKNGQQLPVAEAGADQYVLLGLEGGDFTELTLDGSGSTSPEGLIESYLWMAQDTTFSTESLVSATLPIGNHVFYLTVTDTSGNYSEDQMVVVIEKEKEEEKIGNDKITSSEIKVYPMPVLNYLQVSYKGYDVDNIRVFNVEGQVLADVKGQTWLDMSSYRNGIYLLEISVENQKFLQSVLKN